MRTVVFALTALRLLAQEAAITREGPGSWVRKESESLAVARGAQLQVFARGRIVVRGGPGDRVTYTLTQRARTESEGEAHRLIGIVRISARTSGLVMRIDVQQNSSLLVSNELVITAPRSLASVALQSQFGGTLEAYDLDGAVEALTPSGDIRADRIGGHVVARTGSGYLWLGRVGGIEECFTGAGSITIENAVGGVKDCQTGGGELIVKQAGAPVVLENEGGNITVERAASSVEAHAASGLIRVGEAGGPVTADSRNGAIQVGAARGGVKAESAQGPVRLRGASGAMNVSTALGSIFAELAPGARIQDSWLAAGSGDVTVSIPSNFPVSVMVTNERGGYPQLMTEFPEVRPVGLPLARTPVVAQGSINGGGPVLHINAGTGVVYLRRTK